MVPFSFQRQAESQKVLSCLLNPGILQHHYEDVRNSPHRVHVLTVSRFLGPFNSSGSTVAWVTDFTCPFSDKESNVLYAIVSYLNTVHHFSAFFTTLHLGYCSALRSSLPSIQSPLLNKCNTTMHRQFSFQS